MATEYPRPPDIEIQTWRSAVTLVETWAASPDGYRITDWSDVERFGGPSWTPERMVADRDAYREATYPATQVHRDIIGINAYAVELEYSKQKMQWAIYEAEQKAWRYEIDERTAAQRQRIAVVYGTPPQRYSPTDPVPQPQEWGT